MATKRLTSILIAAAFLAGCAQSSQVPTPEEKTPEIRCTQEAMICPDGTAVGRTGLDCEFAACPEAPFKVAYLKKITGNKDAYTIEVDFAEMYSGEKAEEIALRDTGCTRERLYDGDCAPSLNNGYYISNEDTSPVWLSVKGNGRLDIQLLNETELETASVEKVKNLLEQTDAFTYTPFKIEVLGSEVDVVVITQVYIP